MPVIRCFIAIELPGEIRQKLDAVERQLKTRAGETVKRAVRWVAVNNIHLTLKFLGDVSTDHLPAMAGMLEGVAADHSRFEIIIGGLGAFPNLRRPRVIWIGCEGGQRLSKLQKAVDLGTQMLGFSSEDRPFSPHLTLGRVGDHARAEDLALLVQAVGECKTVELGRPVVEHIHLFKSDLSQGGAVYTSLYQFPLAKD